VAGVLPVLATNRSLPAADTRSDPTLIDVEDFPQAQVLHQVDTPVAASAADFDDYDFVPSPSPHAAVERPGPVGASTGTAKRHEEGEIDEYFDSAPIPGVDLTQTSDRPRGRSDHR